MCEEIVFAPHAQLVELIANLLQVRLQPEHSRYASIVASSGNRLLIKVTLRVHHEPGHRRRLILGFFCIQVQQFVRSRLRVEAHAVSGDFILEKILQISILGLIRLQLLPRDFQFVLQLLQVVCRSP